tara:strand:+ start:228 stop:461 length:234 start_codon:yes stop_codon:yes gene_type:complete
MKDLNNELKKVLAPVLKMSESKINENLNYKNCKKWDSLTHIKIIIKLESKFNIKIKPEDSLNLLSFKKISYYLKSQI